MKEKYAIYKVWDGCEAPNNLQSGSRLVGQIERKVSFDPETLLELARKMQSQQYMREDARFLTWREAARRIHEALGVEP